MTINDEDRQVAQIESQELKSDSPAHYLAKTMTETDNTDAENDEMTIIKNEVTNQNLVVINHRRNNKL